MKVWFSIKLLVFTISCIETSKSGGEEPAPPAPNELSIVRAPITFYNYGVVQVRITATDTSPLSIDIPLNPNRQTFSPPKHIHGLGTTTSIKNNDGLIRKVGQDQDPGSSQPRATESPVFKSPVFEHAGHPICKGPLAVECFNPFGVVYFNKTNTCYCSGDRGPCGESAVIYKEDEYSFLGKCDCGFGFSPRIQIYNTTTRSCSNIFTQAHCNADQWLSLDPVDFLEPICESNPCVNTTRSKYAEVEDVVLYNGECWELNSNCSDITDQFGRVRFEEGYINPRCQTPSFSSGQIGGGPSYGPPPPPEYVLQCKAGSYLAVTGQCKSAMTMTYRRVPKRDFDNVAEMMTDDDDDLDDD